MRLVLMRIFVVRASCAEITIALLLSLRKAVAGQAPLQAGFLLGPRCDVVRKFLKLLFFFLSHARFLVETFSLFAADPSIYFYSVRIMQAKEVIGKIEIVRSS